MSDFDIDENFYFWLMIIVVLVVGCVIGVMRVIK